MLKLSSIPSWLSLLGLFLFSCSAPRVIDAPAKDPTAQVAARAAAFAGTIGRPGGGSITCPALGAASFATLQEAVDKVPGGAQIVLGPGNYSGGAKVTGKTVIIRGAAKESTFISAPGTVLTMDDGGLEVSDLSLVSTGKAPETAVVALGNGVARLESCVITGGTGPGVRVQGQTVLSLLGAELRYNLGGGLVVQSGAVESTASVMDMNGLAGVVFAPLSPTAITSFSSFHDTIVNNWKGSFCTSLVRTGLTPPQELAKRISIRYSVLNSGGLDDVLGPGTDAALAGAGNLLLKDDPGGKQVFRLPESSDFKPMNTIAVKDPDGIEAGALPSNTVLETIRGDTATALTRGWLGKAYELSRFLPRKEYLDVAGKVYQPLMQTIQISGEGRPFGVLLHNLLVIARAAPPSWRLGPVLDVYIERFRNDHSVEIKYFDLFPKASQAFQDKMHEVLETYKGLWPFFGTQDRELAKKVMLSGAIKNVPVTKESVEPLALEGKVKNDYIPKLESSIKVFEGRIDSRRKKIEEGRKQLDNPHLFPPGQNSKRKQLLTQKMEKLEREQAEDSAALLAMRKDHMEAPKEFVVKLQGKVHVRETKAGSWLSVVTAPDAEILVDRQDRLNYLARWVEIEPSGEFPFPGLKQEPPVTAAEEIFAGKVAVTLVSGVIDFELEKLRNLLNVVEQGSATPDDKDRLVDLIYMHSLNYAAAASSEARYKQLQAALEGKDETAPVTLSVTYDPNAGKGKAGVRIQLDLAEPRKAMQEEKASLESLYGGYWKTRERVEQATVKLLGARLDAIVDCRTQAEARKPAPAPAAPAASATQPAPAGPTPPASL